MNKRILIIFFHLGGFLVLLNCATANAKSPVLIKQRAVDELTSESDNPKKSKWFWGFDNWNNREGWSIPGILKGTVTGGALWITIQREEKKESISSWKDQVWAPSLKYELISPPALGVSAKQFNKIIIRMRNLSPETDGFIRWNTTDKPERDTGYVRYTMKPDCKDWQEVVCHMDNRWKGSINQIKIQPAKMWQRGDIWIDWISIDSGEMKPPAFRPDVCSNLVIPTINIPRISQKDFSDAFKVLDECLIVDVPINGFNYPVMSPGGAYGENWWQLDGSLNVAGAKWANQKFVEDVMRGFAEVQAQNPDGRIDLWGGSPFRGQVAEVSSLPRYFEAAYDVASRSSDDVLQNIIFESMKKYLEYWFSPVKKDKGTGLITAVFEETVSNTNLNNNNEVTYQEPKVIAPIDLNVAVATGCYNTARLASYMGKTAEAEKFLNDFKKLSSSINQYLWNNEKNAYYNYNVPERVQYTRLLCSTFDPLQFGIAPADRVEKLILLLLDPSVFYWGVRPLTTIARTEPEYVEATGPYDGRGWLGDIWTLRNLPVIKGLEYTGKHDLAAELAWSTIKTFNANFCEYVVPSTGSGEGVQRYGWSASQYIQAIIEDLFGIEYNSFEKRLRILPHIPNELMNQEVEIRNLKIPSQDDLRLDLKVIQKEPGKATISVKFNGTLTQDMLEICLPANGNKPVKIKNNKGKQLKSESQFEGTTGITGIRMKMKNSVEIIFE
jgi:hypothetical protein